MSNALQVKTIWKYPLEIQEEQTVEVPYGSQLLSLMGQNDLPVLYVLVNPYTKVKEVWHFSLWATGQKIGDEMLRTSIFVGTVSTYEGRLIWHLWRNNPSGS